CQGAIGCPNCSIRNCHRFLAAMSASLVQLALTISISIVVLSLVTLSTTSKAYFDTVSKTWSKCWALHKCILLPPLEEFLIFVMEYDSNCGGGPGTGDAHG